MKWNEFDNRIREILDTPTVPNDGLWDKIAHRLDQQDKMIKKTYWYALDTPKAKGIAAAAVILLLSTLTYTLIHTEGSTGQHEVVHNSSPIRNNDLASLAPQRVVNTIAQPTLQPNHTKQSIKRSAAYSITNTSHNNSKVDNLVASLPPNDNKGTIGKLGILGNYHKASVNIPDNNAYYTTIDKRIMITHQAPNGMQYKQEDIMLDAPILATNNEKKSSKASPLLSVSGGYHYNNVMQGASLSLNAQKQIGSKLLLDAGVGIVMNNPSVRTNEFAGDFLALKRNVNQTLNSVAMASPLFTTAQGLSYLQVNPSVGYMVNQKAKLSIGVDLQQLINTENDVVLFNDRASQLLPRQDYGLTSQIEYNITDRLSTAISAREGINSIVRNDATYANRRYIQLLLKLRLTKNKKR